MTFVQIDAVTTDNLLIALFGGFLEWVCVFEVVQQRMVWKFFLVNYRKIGLNVSEVILP
jgi:hypothetical protein